MILLFLGSFRFFIKELQIPERHNSSFSKSWVHPDNKGKKRLNNLQEAHRGDSEFKL